MTKDKYSDEAVAEFVRSWTTRDGKANATEVVERTGKLFVIMRGHITDQRSVAMVQAIEDHGSVRRAAYALDLSLQTVNKIVKRGQPTIEESTREELLADYTPVAS